jgi:hypothetical protein
MDKAEERQLAEIRRMQEAIKRTNSEKLMRDYTKGIKRLKLELAEYRRYRYGGDATFQRANTKNG